VEQRRRVDLEVAPERLRFDLLEGAKRAADRVVDDHFRVADLCDRSPSAAASLTSHGTAIEFEISRSSVERRSALRASIATR
jgi:hypothetical protein